MRKNVEFKVQSLRTFFIRDRLFFKSFTDEDSLMPPSNSRTKRNLERKNFQTKNQPVEIFFKLKYL